MGYAKVWESIFDGTLADPWQGWVVFVAMLTMSDQDGIVDKTPGAIAARSRLPLDVVQMGIAILEAPDPESRTDGEDGRRIVRIDAHRSWGWRIVNHRTYRDMKSQAEAREQVRARVARHRARKAAEADGDTLALPGVTSVTGNAGKPHAVSSTQEAGETKNRAAVAAAPVGDVDNSPESPQTGERAEAATSPAGEPADAAALPSGVILDALALIRNVAGKLDGKEPPPARKPAANKRPYLDPVHDLVEFKPKETQKQAFVLAGWLWKLGVESTSTIVLVIRHYLDRGHMIGNIHQYYRPGSHYWNQLTMKLAADHADAEHRELELATKRFLASGGA